MSNSLRTRLWLTYTLLSVGILCMVGTGLFLYLLKNSPSTIRARQRVSVIASFIGQRPALLRVLLASEQAADVRMLIMQPDGTILTDTYAGVAPPIPPLPIIRKQQPQEDRSFRDSDGTVWLYSATRLKDKTILIVALPRPPLPLRQMLRENLFLLLVGVAALLLAPFLAWWMSRWITTPLRRMMQSAQALAAGQHRPIPLEGPSEIQAMAYSFNEMSQRVQASQQAQRDLVANVSHDLKTPLTSIQGFAQAILDGTASSPEESKNAAQVIHDEASRMHRMALDLLELARMDAGIADFKRQPVDLANLLHGLAEKFAPQARQAQVNLDLQIQPIPSVIGDEDRLIQVFTNLVDNALKYSPAGGQIMLQARLTGSQVEISISDTGPGIPPEELPRIFERFYQTDKARSSGRRGVGLGLAIAREIVLAHGGRITVRSNPGQGSAFTVTLPT